MSEHWTHEEYQEYLRTGREPVRSDIADMIEAYLHPVSQEEINRRYEEAEKRGEVMVLEIPNDGRNPTSCPPPAPKKRRKYGNKPEYIGWKRFDSRKEARFYRELMARVKAGELKCVLRQVPFDLAEKERLQYFADFVAIRPDNTIEAVYDVKSEATRKSEKYVIKKKLMRELWDIEITEV